jgi:hypothetical protein
MRAERFIMPYSSIRLMVLSSLVLLVGLLATGRGNGQEAGDPQYDAAGDLLAPEGFETWIFVGSNLGLAYDDELPVTTALEVAHAHTQVFHNIYIDREAFDSFAANRTFPDPTILVMEIFGASDREPKGVLSDGVFNGPRVGLQVAVKNTERPDGSTTPWAYYIFTDPSDPSQVAPKASAFPDAACFDCHEEHASEDNVWVQFYPTLRKLQ